MKWQSEGSFIVVNGENGCKYQGTRGEIILTIGCIIVRLLLTFLPHLDVCI